MKKILVTGGAGFIGSNFCNINKGNFEITALDNLFLGDKRNLDEDVAFIEGDACNSEDLDKVGPVDYVLHLLRAFRSPFLSGWIDDFTSTNSSGSLSISSTTATCTPLRSETVNRSHSILLISETSIFRFM